MSRWTYGLSLIDQGIDTTRGVVNNQPASSTNQTTQANAYNSQPWIAFGMTPQQYYSALLANENLKEISEAEEVAQDALGQGLENVEQGFENETLINAYQFFKGQGDDDATAYGKAMAHVHAQKKQAESDIEVRQGEKEIDLDASRITDGVVRIPGEPIKGTIGEIRSAVYGRSNVVPHLPIMSPELLASPQGEMIYNRKNKQLDKYREENIEGLKGITTDALTASVHPDYQGGRILGSDLGYKAQAALASLGIANADPEELVRMASNEKTLERIGKVTLGALSDAEREFVREVGATLSSSPESVLRYNTIVTMALEKARRIKSINLALEKNMINQDTAEYLKSELPDLTASKLKDKLNIFVDTVQGKDTVLRKNPEMWSKVTTSDGREVDVFRYNNPDGTPNRKNILMDIEDLAGFTRYQEQ